jgi:hypothetical protein
MMYRRQQIQFYVCVLVPLSGGSVQLYLKRRYFYSCNARVVGTLLRAHAPIGWLCKTLANILVYFSLVMLECVGTLWELVGGRGNFLLQLLWSA